jgi:hypothetical protein
MIPTCTPDRHFFEATRSDEATRDSTGEIACRSDRRAIARGTAIAGDGATAAEPPAAD